MPNSERGEENKKKHLVFLEEETHHVVLVPVGWSMILICLERYVRASSSSPCWPPALSLFLLVSCWRPSRPPLSVSRPPRLLLVFPLHRPSSPHPSTCLCLRLLRRRHGSLLPSHLPFPHSSSEAPPRPFINPPSLLPNPS